jgi:hypothetical protein
MIRPARPTLAEVPLADLSFDVLCDPAEKVDRIEFRSVATESFLGIAGVTLLAAPPGGQINLLEQSDHLLQK